MDQSFLFEPDKRHEPQEFQLPDGRSITAADLQKAGHDLQIEAMRQWFYANFQDPVEETPYDSGEGGYQYIWGGPYDPLQELISKFEGIVPDEVIKELADELSDISCEWSGHPDALESSNQLDDYLFRSIVQSSNHLDAFRNNILSIKNLLETRVALGGWQCLLRLLYVNVITALETYLSDKFISSINTDRNLLRRFVETTPEFQSEKISLSDVFKASEEIEQRVKTYLSEFVWHRLDRVKPMFRDTLSVEFPSDMGELYRAIVLRHDHVHRNGKTKEGKEHILSEDDISKLIEKAESLVTHIESVRPTVSSVLPSGAPPEF